MCAYTARTASPKGLIRYLDTHQAREEYCVQLWDRYHDPAVGRDHVAAEMLKTNNNPCPNKYCTSARKCKS